MIYEPTFTQMENNLQVLSCSLKDIIFTDQIVKSNFNVYHHSEAHFKLNGRLYDICYRDTKEKLEKIFWQLNITIDDQPGRQISAHSVFPTTYISEFARRFNKAYDVCADKEAIDVLIGYISTLAKEIQEVLQKMDDLIAA